MFDLGRLPEFLIEARGHPLLSAWEEGFLASVSGHLRTYGERLLLSEKQSAVLEKIEIKLSEPVPTVNDDPEDEQEPPVVADLWSSQADTETGHRRLSALWAANFSRPETVKQAKPERPSPERSPFRTVAPAMDLKFSRVSKMRPSPDPAGDRTVPSHHATIGAPGRGGHPVR